MVDCGLRKPVLQHYSETPDTTGQVDVLTMGRRMQGVWHGPMLKLKSITAGLPPLNPTELLNSRRFADFSKQVRGQFDYVAGGHAPRDGRDGLLRRRGGPRGWGLARHGCAGHAEELAAAGHTRPRRSGGQHAWHHPVQRGCLQGRVRDLLLWPLWPARAAERNPEILETASRDRQEANGRSDTEGPIPEAAPQRCA